MMWTALIPVGISAATQIIKLLPKVTGGKGLKDMVPKNVGRILFPAISLGLGALSGSGLIGQDIADAAGGVMGGLGMGVAGSGVFTVLKNVGQVFKS